MCLAFSCCLFPFSPSDFPLASCFPFAFWLSAFFMLGSCFMSRSRLLAFPFYSSSSAHFFLLFLFTLIKLDMIEPPSQFEISVFYLSIAFHFFNFLYYSSKSWLPTYPLPFQILLFVFYSLLLYQNISLLQSGFKILAFYLSFFFATFFCCLSL